MPASLAGHGLVAAIWLAAQALPRSEPPPQVPAEIELVLGSGGQTPGEATAAESQQPPASTATAPTESLDGSTQATMPPHPAAPPAVRLGDPASGPTAELQDNDGRFRAAEGDAGNLPPPYPRGAGAGRQQGAVLVRMHVARDGHVEEAEILLSSGFRELDRAAREALARWRFTPALRDGQPVADTVDLNINFRLD